MLSPKFSNFKIILAFYFISLFTVFVLDGLLIPVFAPVDWVPTYPYIYNIFVLILVIILRAIIVEYFLHKVNENRFSFEKFMTSIIVFGPPMLFITFQLGLSSVLNNILYFLTYSNVNYDVKSIIAFLLYALIFDFSRFSLLTILRGKK